MGSQTITPPPIGAASVSEPGGATLMGISMVMVAIAAALWRRLKS
jgi:hypothetical protein